MRARELGAFVALLYGSIALLGVVVVLWVDPIEFDTRRLAVLILLGWALLVPWTFWAWVHRCPVKPAP